MKIFEGRIGRIDYLKAFLVVWLLGGITFAIGVSIYNVAIAQVHISGIEAGINYGIYIWIFLLPAFAKRMHDIGHSGLWLLGSIWFPVLGLLLALLLLIWPGQNKSNKYGAIPSKVPGFLGTMYKSGNVSDVKANKISTKVRIQEPLGSREDVWELDQDNIKKWADNEGVVHVINFRNNDEDDYQFTDKKIWEELNSSLISEEFMNAKMKEFYNKLKS